MKLKIKKREAKAKSERFQLRLAKQIPAVLYEAGKEAESISVSLMEFEALLRKIKFGRLSTTKITLVNEENQETNVLVKEIQYHPTSYKILHLDFQKLDDEKSVKVNIPVECIGVADCVGIKLGGTLRQVIRQVRVQCLPKNIPTCFELDIQAMNIRDVKKISDLQIPDGVKPLVDRREVAVVIAKR